MFPLNILFSMPLFLARSAGFGARQQSVNTRVKTGVNDVVNNGVKSTVNTGVKDAVNKV